MLANYLNAYFICIVRLPEKVIDVDILGGIATNYQGGGGI